jgi:hypothetical protein
MKPSAVFLEVFIRVKITEIFISNSIVNTFGGALFAVR